ncbi:MAG TPA: hypothetical protein VFB79_21425 [Candidatus Angelobacter sp.]|nr:hypothetical protein [Candidatus Angelobacter sp.]
MRAKRATTDVSKIAFTLPCRRCSSQPGHACTNANGGMRVFQTTRFRWYYKHHKIRVNDAKAVIAKQKELELWNSLYAHETPSTGETAQK